MIWVRHILVINWYSWSILVVIGCNARITLPHIMNWNIFDCALIKQSFISLMALQRINCAEWCYYRIECRDILNQNFFEIMLWYLTLTKYNIKSNKPHNHIYYFTRYDLYISLPLLNFQQILKIVLVSNKLDEVTHNVNHIAKSLAYMKSAQ